jgi:cytochrome b subunit of formate dehydrogenase
VAHPVDSYKQSVHARAVALGKDAATCSSCHGSHDIYPATDTRSKVNHWRVPQTCAQCHKEIAREFNESVHGEAVKSGVRDAPVCIDCHGEHQIIDPKSTGSPLNAENVSAETCGRCHGDPRLALRYDLPADRLPSYADSYHGLAVKEGRVTAANCASCHGVHSILRSSDPRSTVNKANLARTCGACHKGVIEARFAIGPVHVQTSTGAAHPVVKWIRWTYWTLIPMTLGFMILHNLLDFLQKLIRPHPHHVSGAKVTRMNRNFRIAHWGVIFSFPTLVVTGFALKYPDAWWARPLLLWESHFGFRGAVHRTAAVILVASTLYHLIHLALNKRDRVFLWAMIPQIKDATDIVQVFSYNLGLTKVEPKFAKFNYAEKLEYLAFMWGTLVMAVSGFLLWFNNFTLTLFPQVGVGRSHRRPLLRGAARDLRHPDLALLHGDLRSARLSDGYGLARRQSPSRSLPPFPSGILPRPGTRAPDRVAERAFRFSGGRWSWRQFSGQATREELAPRQSVILSGVAVSRSEAATESKDPHPSNAPAKCQGILPETSVERTLLSAPRGGWPSFSLTQPMPWVPLDKREGSVKGKLVLGSAEAPLFRQRG